ncbi:MAG: hypothetical protein KAS17_06010 [Victivallaceae bacterium]|nr:hypothetical protein [Victivallaceae bacterium]
MKPRLVLLMISAIGLLPGMIIVIISLLSCFQKQPDGVIGGSRLPSFIYLTGFDISIRTALFPMILMFLGIILYIGGFIWMTRAIR